MEQHQCLSSLKEVVISNAEAIVYVSEDVSDILGEFGKKKKTLGF